LKTVKAYIKTNVVTECTHRSSSPAAELMICPQEIDSGLLLCVNYRAPNKATEKKPIPSPTELGDARQVMRSPDLQQIGPQEQLTSHMNRGR